MKTIIASLVFINATIGLYVGFGLEWIPSMCISYVAFAFYLED